MNFQEVKEAIQVFGAFDKSISMDGKNCDYFTWRKFTVFVLDDAVAILSPKDSPIFKIHRSKGITFSDEIIESMLTMDIKQLPTKE